MLTKLGAILVLVCISASLFVGCTFFKVNADRVANQELYTIKGKNGITLSLSRNEIIDYYNNYAYSLTNYYGYTAEQALDFVIESKIKNKYLITVAMSELIDTVQFSNRIPGNLVGNGNVSVPKDVLTFAEYYAAIYSVNSSISSSITSSIDTAKQQKILSEMNKISKTSVSAVEFAPTTIAYLKNEYYVNQNIDKNEIKIVVTYDDETKSEPSIVPDTMYGTEFTSTEAATDSKMVINFDEKIYATDGAVTYETHTLEHTYNVVSPRATETKTEVTNDDDVKIGNVTVNRYDSVETIKTKLGDAFNDLAIIDLDAKYATLKKDSKSDPNEIEAYRQLIENLKKSYKTMTYIYNSAYESAVTSALSSEIQKNIIATYTDEAWKNIIVAEYKYLYGNARLSYQEKDLSDTDAIVSDFAESIKSNLDSFYYYPAIDKLGDYVYVYQILFNFSDKQKELLTYAGSNEDLKQQYFEYLKSGIESKISNIKYNADYDCEKHELGLDVPCKWVEEDSINNEADCPSLAYMMNLETGDFLTAKFLDVYSELQDGLSEIYGENFSGLNDETKQQDALRFFMDYVYKYNDDGGIMNSSTGYLIAPDGVKDPNGFYESFVDLAHDVYAANSSIGNAFVSDGNGGFKLGYAFTDYGVHIIMTSMKPFANYSNSELVFANDDELYNYICTQKINVKGDTIYKILSDKLVSDRKSKGYNDYTNSIIDANLHENTEIVTKNEKAVKELYKSFSS